jgi:hypothetical protein
MCEFFRIKCDYDHVMGQHDKMIILSSYHNYVVMLQYYRCNIIMIKFSCCYDNVINLTFMTTFYKIFSLRTSYTENNPRKKTESTKFSEEFYFNNCS